jgi:thymidine kinase
MLEVITGCMFSGKSEELTRRLRRCEIAGMSVLAFKPAIDNRYDEKNISSHSLVKFDAITFSDFNDLKTLILADVFKRDVIGIDEAQFLGEDFAEYIESLANTGMHIIVAGLDTDYLGRPFGSIPKLMAIADNVMKLSAICTAVNEEGKICGDKATRTYRTEKTEELIKVGAEGSYQARCRKCWNKK